MGSIRPDPLSCEPELHWRSGGRPLPRQWVVPDGATVESQPDPDRPPLDICRRLRTLCEDVVGRCAELSHVRMAEVLVTCTPSRNDSRFGLQARTTPLRFRGGALVRRHGGVEYGVQRYFVDGREMLYLLTFCLPRFLDQPIEEKLVTVFHELWHIGPAFDGDLRRHPGRHPVHAGPRADYDRRMRQLARDYVRDHPAPGVWNFLRLGSRDLWERANGLVGVVVPRPKLVPVRAATLPASG